VASIGASTAAASFGDTGGRALSGGDRLWQIRHVTLTLAEATAAFGSAAKAKLSAPAVSGQPEDQLRAPLEAYVAALAGLGGIPARAVTMIGESSLADLQTRPDYAVTYMHALVGFIELKAPGKGADPRRFADAHDKAQWQKLQALPNLVYTDGNAFSLWRDGELVRSIVRLSGDVTDAGSRLEAPEALVGLVGDFLRWSPVPPRSPKALAQTAARLCRLLRDEVSEQLAIDSPVLTSLAVDWRHLLFPEATDAQFADSYAQAVTFGLLLARVRDIDLSHGVGSAAARLAALPNSLIGAALRILTDAPDAEQTLPTSVRTLARVLSVVDWPTVSRGEADAWLYFYEEFLTVYDKRLRQQTGSYYTPVPVVAAMTGLVDEALRDRFGQPGGLASQAVTVLDPGLGTGTYLLEVVRRIAESVTADQGAGAVPGALEVALARLIGFELQLGPFAVAQLRLIAELTELGATPTQRAPLRTFVTNTIDDPFIEESTLGTWYEPIAKSRREANRVKAGEPVLVVIGNPPYKEKSKGQGGWIEHGAEGHGVPLADFMPPAALDAGAHVKHLYNPYVYFWRWATWKVFDHHPEADKGIVCFISVAGFLAGPGFAGMRGYLRARADAIWVIDCSPEGLLPPVNTRIFQAVKQPVCIMLVLRDGSSEATIPAPVRYRQLAPGHRDSKFTELARLSLNDDDWELAAADPYAPFRPGGTPQWRSFPALDDLLRWSGSGIMPGRTWPIAPDTASLAARWNAFVRAPVTQKPALLQEHKQDRRIDTVLTDNLPGYPPPVRALVDETGPPPPSAQIGYRSFDRQWLLADKRLINRPNPTLWKLRSEQQVFLTAPHLNDPRFGPAITFTALIPDLDHYDGRGGRVYPLWLDAGGRAANTPAGLLHALSERLGISVGGEDLFAYIAAVVAHPGYTARFSDEFAGQGLRVPVTANGMLFDRAARVGRRILWLHCRGERFVDAGEARPRAAPRLPLERSPKVLAEYPIESSSVEMPDKIGYDAASAILSVGSGRISNVPPAVWDYRVGAGRTTVLTQWFSSRRRHRERPVIGSRRVSPLSQIQPDHWLSEYTSDLIDLLHTLGLLVDLEAEQADLLGTIVAGPVVSVADLTIAGVLPIPKTQRVASAVGTIPRDPETLFG